MIKGYLDQAHKNQCSTKAPLTTDTTEDTFPSSAIPTKHSHHCYVALMEPT
jgi:hypothetical protein